MSTCIHFSHFSLACVASVSVGLSARSRRFWLFGCAKIGASATLIEAAHFFALALIFARPKKRKVPRTCGKPYGNACYAGYFSFTTEMDSLLALNFAFPCGLCGFHVYKELWNPRLNEKLDTIHEENNPHPGGYLGQFLLGMCRWPLQTPTPL